MFCPELSPAITWHHQLTNQRQLYTNFVFPNCAKQFQDEDPNFGELMVNSVSTLLQTHGVQNNTESSESTDIFWRTLYFVMIYLCFTSD